MTSNPNLKNTTEDGLEAPSPERLLLLADRCMAEAGNWPSDHELHACLLETAHWCRNEAVSRTQSKKDRQDG